MARLETAEFARLHWQLRWNEDFPMWWADYLLLSTAIHGSARCTVDRCDCVQLHAHPAHGVAMTRLVVVCYACLVDSGDPQPAIQGTAAFACQYTSYVSARLLCRAMSVTASLRLGFSCRQDRFRY